MLFRIFVQVCSYNHPQSTPPPPPQSLDTTIPAPPHCWKHFINSWADMLSKAASDPRWTSAKSTKRPCFQLLFHPCEQKKVSRNVVRRVQGWWGWDTTYQFVFSQKWGVFSELAEVPRESLAALDAISIEDFRQCSQKRELRWNRCIQSHGWGGGGYFERE